MKLKSILVLALTLLCAMVLAGCDEQKQGEAGSKTVLSSSSGSSSSSSSSSQSGSKAQLVNIKVYYPDENATGLVAVEKSIKDTDNKYQAAVEALMAGTEKKGLANVFPKKAKLLQVTVSGCSDRNRFYQQLSGGGLAGRRGIPV